ncbi:MAG TPA: hypothetical protein VEJ22_07480 [Nitrospirota bacterium]|nr:hypothetical protein [Nitrospirota bacterium]
MSEYLWHCPFCNTDQTVTDQGRQITFADLTIASADGPRRLVTKFVVCPNPECSKFSLSASLHSLEVSGNRSYTGKHIKTWPLVPPSRARSFPVDIPQPVLEDYREACLAFEFSPKVSSALSRRCLSEILRDFWRVQPGRLGDEFRQIRATVDPLTWEAIESVRKSGMIGARMDSEGAEILDIEPGEAESLIGLIETLIQDWYVTREERRKRLAKMKEITGQGAREPATEEKEQGSHS